MTIYKHIVLKKKNLKNLLFLPILLSLCSCFQIIEEISMNSDGSGEMTITINLSESKTKLASIMLLDSVRGHNVPNEEEIRASLSKAVAYLKASPGIGNVKKNLDLDNFIASVHFSFQDVSDINHVTENILKDHKVNFANPTTYSFLPKKGVFKRKYHSVKKGGEAFSKLSQEDQTIFAKAVYVNIIRFDRNISASSNPQTRISPSKKALMLQCSVQDIINGNINISNQITLTKNP